MTKYLFGNTKKLVCLTVLFSILLFMETVFAEKTKEQKVRVPSGVEKEHFDEYFGVKVSDPYRWMETENTPELTQWIADENKVTFSYLEKIPFRETIKKEITARINYPRYSLPEKKNGLYFFSKNDGLQNQSVLYTAKSLSDEPRVLLDPNTFSKDGTVSLSGGTSSKDARYFGYLINRSGSDWQEAYVLETSTGKILSDHLKWLKFSGLSWYKNGFFYSRYDAPEKGKELSAKNSFHQVYYHQVGTAQESDQLIYKSAGHPDRNCFATVDDDEEWLFIFESESTYGYRVLFKKLSGNGDDFAKGNEKGNDFKVLFPTFEAETEPVLVRNGRFYLLTDYKAPNRRLVVADPAHPEPENWKDVIPEGPSVLRNVLAAGGRFVADYLKDAASETVFFDYNGKRIGELKLPALGICGFSGDKDETELFYGFTSFVYPTVVYRYDLSTEQQKVLFDTKIDFNPSDYTTERLWYTSRDGTKAPVFVTYKNGMKRDGTNPLLLYGYGGFNINMTPTFKPARTVFLDHGGIFAVAVLRGGGEYGEKWHQAGTKMKKQNVFDDFISAAEFLIKEKYTSKTKLAINGGSNGGLLVGAAITQRPDLFRVAVPQVGVLDMLRYHKFTIGWAWASDYGTSEESKEMFEYLLKYSPLHNVKPGTDYPATLIMTSDHDDRVVPAHSFKFGAALQKNNSGKNPVLIRIETRAGHGAGKPVTKIIEESADVYSFILFNLQ